MEVFFLCLGWLLAGFALFAAWRFYRRAVIFDEVFRYLYDDIEINLHQFSQMATSNMLSDEPTVQDAHRKMMVMGKRLNEILTRMEDARGVKMRPTVPPFQPRPKVV
jgi:hypothetical protein